MKVRVKKYYNLGTRVMQAAPFGLQHDRIYNCKSGDALSASLTDKVMLDGHDVWLPAGEFDVIEEAPKLYRSSNETPDDISAWFCQNRADPLAAACKEIRELRNDLHDLKNEINGKIGSAIAIVDLGRVYQDQIETLMEAFNKSDDSLNSTD